MNDGIAIYQLQLYLLLFTDDAVLFSETREFLQNQLNNMETYCKTWNLTVNVLKTKIVVFRKGVIWVMRTNGFIQEKKLKLSIALHI